MRIRHLVPLLLLAFGCNGPAGSGDVAPSASIGPSGTPDGGPSPYAGPGQTDPDAGTPAGGLATTSVWNSGASSCADLAPVAAREPVTFIAKLGASAQGVMACGTLVDGLDHVAVCSDRTGAAPADHTSTVIHSLDGTVAATLNGHPLVAMPRGFVNAHDALDYGQQSSITAWTAEASNTLITGAVIPVRESDWCSWDVTPDGRIATACWTQTSGSRWRLYDEALRPLDAGHATDDHAAIRGIDRNGLAIVATPAGARWRDLDGTPVSAPIEGGFAAGQRLIQGGFVTEAGVLSSGATRYGPRPAWMPGTPLAIVRGGKAYASVVLQEPKGCVQRVEVRAADGTVCSTVEVRGESDCTSARLTVGARGSLSDLGDEQGCADLLCARKVRVWPHLLE